MEVDPKYADCIVRRYQEYIGKQVVLEVDAAAVRGQEQSDPCKSGGGS
jgi:hypothetical protein